MRTSSENLYDTLKFPLNLRPFSWIVVNGKLLTNQQSYMRRLSVVSDYVLRGNACEDLNQLVRECHMLNEF